MQRNSPIAVGIDIGTTKVRCVVGSLGDNDTQPTVVGAGSADNHGMRKGIVNNVEETAAAIAAATEEAERISGQSINSATVSINGSHIRGLDSKGVVAISASSREITIDDLHRVEEAATVVQLPPNREILQVFAKSYTLDGQENVKEPIGMQGVRLEVDAHIVTAASPAVKNLDKAFDALDIQVNNHILAGLAAGEAVLDEKQRDSGTAVVDIGAGTTNLVVYEEDDVQHVAVIPIGSINITNDLAIGLRTDLDIADEVKIKHARAAVIDQADPDISITRDESVYEFKRRDVEAVVQARLEELFELIDQELRAIGKSGKLPGGIVLTGEGAMLPGLDEFVKNQMHLPARVSKPRHYSGVIDTSNTAAYATAVGLMQLDMSLQGISRPREGGLDVGAAWSGVKKFLGRFRS